MLIGSIEAPRHDDDNSEEDANEAAGDNDPVVEAEDHNGKTTIFTKITDIDASPEEDQLNNQRREERKDSEDSPVKEMLHRRETIDMEKDILEFNHKDVSLLATYDETMDKHQVSVMEGYSGDPTAFEVADPIVGSHVSYTVKGYDNEGTFEGARRYNDFFKLRHSLLSRMPGVYVPPVPPKKMIGNKNEQFLEERKYFLQRFLQLS